MNETRTVVIERAIAHPPEKIWRALTQPHLIAEWLMQNDFQPAVGHRFTLSRAATPDFTVVIDCAVTEVEPEETLSYTWSAFGTETVVTFTLTPIPAGTLLRVEQAGFDAANRDAIKGATVSWRQFLAALDALVTRNPT